MSKKQLIVNTNQNLSDEYAIKCAGSDLYRIGLSLFASNNVKRKTIFNPLFTSFIVFVYTFKVLVLMFVKTDNPKFFLLTGDFAYFMNARIYIGLTIFNFGLIAISSQLLHFGFIGNK